MGALPAVVLGSVFTKGPLERRFDEILLWMNAAYFSTPTAIGFYSSYSRSPMVVWY
jgi:hypothetical protein